MKILGLKASLADHQHIYVFVRYVHMHMQDKRDNPDNAANWETHTEPSHGQQRSKLQESNSMNSLIAI